MSSISLHKTKGVNPRLTFCPNCGGEGPDIVLLGSRERKVTCDKCGCVNYGSSRAGKCGRCEQPLFDGKVEKIDEYERLPGSLCAECERVLEEQKRVVAEGGVLFKCKKCGSEGAIKANASLAKEVRKQLGIEPPKPCGVELESCPACEENAK